MKKLILHNAALLLEKRGGKSAPRAQLPTTALAAAQPSQRKKVIITVEALMQICC